MISKDLNKLYNMLISKKNTTKREKLLFYIRLYTDLLNAYNNIGKNRYKKSINYLNKAKNFTKEANFSEETLYIKRINSLITDVLKNMPCKRCKLLDCDYCDKNNVKTHLQIAQNICLIRMLKV